MAFAPAAVEPATADDFEKHPLLVKGYIGPWSETGPILGEESATGIRYFLDPRVVDGTSWVHRRQQRREARALARRRARLHR